MIFHEEDTRAFLFPADPNRTILSVLMPMAKDRMSTTK